MQPRRGQIIDLLDWYARQLSQLGVEIRLNAFLDADEIKESFELGIGQSPPVILTSALTGDGCLMASDILLNLQSTGRSSKARWRERLLSRLEQRILKNPQLDSLLSSLASGSIELDEALNKLNN